MVQKLQKRNNQAITSKGSASPSKPASRRENYNNIAPPAVTGELPAMAAQKLPKGQVPLPVRGRKM